MPSTRAKARALKVALPHIARAARSRAVRSEFVSLAGAALTERRGGESARRLANDKQLRSDIAAVAASVERVLGRSGEVRRHRRRRSVLKSLGIFGAMLGAWKMAIRGTPVRPTQTEPHSTPATSPVPAVSRRE